MVEKEEVFLQLSGQSLSVSSRFSSISTDPGNTRYRYHSRSGPRTQEFPEDFPGNRECPEYFDLVPARMPDRCHVIARVLQSPDPDKADALPVADDKMEREIVSRFKSKYQQPQGQCLFLCLPDRNDRPVPPGHRVSRCVQVLAGVPGLNGGETGSSRFTPAGRGGTLCCIRLLVPEPVIRTAGRT